MEKLDIWKGEVHYKLLFHSTLSITIIFKNKPQEYNYKTEFDMKLMTTQLQEKNKLIIIMKLFLEDLFITEMKNIELD